MKAFVVDWELRHAGRQLISPFCDNRYLPDESARSTSDTPAEDSGCFPIVSP